MVDTKALKRMGSKIISATYYFSRGFIESHLIIPSCIRKVDKEKEQQAYPIGSALPLIGTMIFGAYPLIGYYFLFSYDKKIATATLATQLTTNAISGLYEWYRYESNKDKLPITLKTPETKPSNLEIKTTETPKIESQQEKPINPWDTDIPKYDNLILEDRK